MFYVDYVIHIPISKCFKYTSVVLSAHILKIEIKLFNDR